MKFKKFTKQYYDLMPLVLVLLFAVVLTILRPIGADTLGYFADVSTPLLIFAAILTITLGIKKRR